MRNFDIVNIGNYSNQFLYLKRNLVRKYKQTLVFKLIYE